MSSGICFNFARLGKCDKDARTFQHVACGQFRKALGNESGDQNGGHERQHSKGAGRDGSKGARGGNGKEKRNGKNKSKLKGYVAPANNDEERLDMKALPVAARRKLSRPRLCSDFLKGCYTKGPCPHHRSETVVAETKEKDAVFKTVAAARTDSRGCAKKGKES